MSERLLAEVNSAALVWARDVLGMPLDVAAGKIGLSEGRLQEFESGRTLPTIKQLRTIAKVYRRPTAFFYLRVLPPKPQRLEDFRDLPGHYDPNLPELVDAIDAAKQRRLTALELSSLLGYNIHEFGVAASLEDPPARIANKLRDRLGVSIAAQRSWRDPYRILRGWITATEEVGVLVTQFSQVEVSAARGFSLTERPYPLVAINGKDSPHAKVFTLFHELVHIAVGASGVCDLHETANRANGIEPFCNRVAAEALVPLSNLLAEPLVTHHNDVEWEDWRVRELATTYGVGTEVLLRRLLTVGRTTDAFYRAKREEYLRAYMDAAAGPGGFLHHFRGVLRDNGMAITRLVLEAYRADVITPTEVSRFLGGVKLRHVPAIEDALAARAQ